MCVGWRRALNYSDDEMAAFGADLKPGNTLFPSLEANKASDWAK